MYTVTTRYIDKMMTDRSQVMMWYGYVRLPGPEGGGGVYYNFESSDIKQNSSKWIRQCCSGNKLEFGTTYAAELDLSLYLTENNGNYYLDGKIVDRYMFFGAKVHLNFRLFFDDNTYEDVECGEFFVSNAERTSNVLSLTCYDAMTKFNKPVGASITGTAYDWFLAACNACDVTLAFSRTDIQYFPNAGTNLYIYPALQIDTWRNLIGFVAIVLGANVYIDRNGFLNIKRYSMSSIRTIRPSWRYSSKITDYECFYTDLVLQYVPSETNETYSTQDAGDGLTYPIGKNPFCQITNLQNRQTFMQNIMNEMANVEYTPLEITCPCDPSFDLMDAITLSGNQAIEGKLSGLTYIELSLGGSQIIKCGGENPYLQAAQSKIDAQIEGLDSKTSGDAIYYYDYTNIQDINLAAGDARDIIEFEFVTTKRTHLDFHAQILLQLGESVSEPVWLLLTYYLNGAEIREFHPAEHFARADPESRHMLSLMYAFAMPGGQQSSFKVKLQIYGSSLTIPQYNINAWLAGSGLADEEEGGDERIWNNSQIEVQEITITENGTYIAPEKTAYSPLIVNVEGGGGEVKQYKYIWTPLDISIGTYIPNFATFTSHNAVVYNGRIHLFGQNTTATTLHVSWSDEDGYREESILPFSTFRSVFVADSTYIHLLGGVSGSGTSDYSRVHYIWDGNSWQDASAIIGSSLPMGLNTQTIPRYCISYNDSGHKLYVVGGGTAALRGSVNVIGLDDHSLVSYPFDWTSPDTYLYANACWHSDNLYIAGFQTYTDLKNFYRMDGNGSFTKLNDVPWLYNEKGGALFEYDGSLHYVGASNFQNSSCGIRRYNASLDEWIDVSIYPRFQSTEFPNAPSGSPVIVTPSNSSGLNSIKYNDAIHVIGLQSNNGIGYAGHWKVERIEIPTAA